MSSRSHRVSLLAPLKMMVIAHLIFFQSAINGREIEKEPDVEMIHLWDNYKVYVVVLLEASSTGKKKRQGCTIVLKRPGTGMEKEEESADLSHAAEAHSNRGSLRRTGRSSRRTSEEGPCLSSDIQSCTDEMKSIPNFPLSNAQNRHANIGVDSSSEGDVVYNESRDHEVENDSRNEGVICGDKNEQRYRVKSSRSSNDKDYMDKRLQTRQPHSYCSRGQSKRVSGEPNKPSSPRSEESQGSSDKMNLPPHTLTRSGSLLPSNVLRDDSNKDADMSIGSHDHDVTTDSTNNRSCCEDRAQLRSSACFKTSGGCKDKGSYKSDRLQATTKSDSTSCRRQLRRETEERKYDMRLKPLRQQQFVSGSNSILPQNVVRNGSSDEEVMYTESSEYELTTDSANGRIRYPRFADRGQRTLSFGRWDNPFRCNTSEAAEAGLFVDTVLGLVCFYCGVVVPQLSRFDDAWIEHARWNRRCDFVRSSKGEPFVRMVQEMYSNDTDESNIEEGIERMEIDDRRHEHNADRHDRETESSFTVGSPPACGGAVLSGNQLDEQFRMRGAMSSHSYQPETTQIPRRTRPVPPLSSSLQPRNTRSGPRIPKRQVQAREVRARLDLDWAQELMTMGYSQDLVGAVIAEQLIYQGDDFKSFKDMLMATIDAADMGERYPVRHYALGLAQNNVVSTGHSTTTEHTTATVCQGKTWPTSSNTNSAMALSAGASSWTETTPPSGNTRNVTTGNEEAVASSIITENRELKERKACKICYETDANMVFLPCGHLVVCEGCYRRVRECPLCRRPIEGALKTYLS